ncbi:glutamate--cysteine ligase [Nitrosospira sp. Nl5]|nr:glutamate--cysteine ligase [Nitrosospira sp. Nl5]SCY74553.1 glutamate--cysteine ligase [Nitrosospira sp. Nl5]
MYNVVILKRYLYSMPVPRLATGPSGPILDLERCAVDAILFHRALYGRWRQYVPFNRYPDFRSSGFKLASMEIQNLFPDCFNKLDAEFLSLCIVGDDYDMRDSG